MIDDRDMAERFEALDELPFAILYYSRAGDKEQVTALQEKLGIQEKVQEPLLTTTTSLYLVVLFSLFLAFTGSLWIWKRRKIYLKTSLCSTFGIALLLAYLFIVAYLSPVTAVVIQGTTLYTAPHQGAERVNSHVLLPGSTVEAFSLEKEGFWLKVVIPSGDVGYLPASKVRLIR